MADNRYNVVILGGGPAGERAAVQAARAGKRVALIERQNVVGGTCVNWGTIPSKTLRESAIHVWTLRNRKIEGIRSEITDRITMAAFMHRERIVVQRELELINRTLVKYAISLFHGHGSFVDPHTISIASRTGSKRLRIHGDIVVIATGSSPNRPPDIDFNGETIFDSDTILHLSQVPESMIVLGAGVIGTNASELVHIGQAFLKCPSDAWQIAETLYNYPTLSDLYRHAALEAITAAKRRRGTIKRPRAGSPASKS